MSHKLIVILGPTASGKSSLAISLAKKFNGEVVSADSRQVYRGMDIGTGKVSKKEMLGIPHYLLDIASPRQRFTVTQYRDLALKAVDKILKKGKIPILCGGTGFYIQSVIDGIIIPEVRPDWKLRRKLEKKSAIGLHKTLLKLDPARAKNIDKNNPRRLIRAIEIVLKTKRPVQSLNSNPPPYSCLMIGIKKSPEELKELIKKRFLDWLRQGFVNEVKKLKNSGLSFKKIEDLGLNYRISSLYLQKKIGKEEMIKMSLSELWHYAKRQMTWFKKDPRIVWISDKKKAQSLVKNFLQC